MSALPTILCLLLASASFVSLGYWFIVGLETIRTLRLLPTARAGLAVADEPARRPARWPKVCIVIPAHNEQVVIARVTESLRRQDYPDFSAVFALDRCTDETLVRLQAAAAGDPRISWITIDHCPDDWAGKVHAVHQGSLTPAAKQAEVLLFTDADTIFDPRCLTATVALLIDRKADMLSLLSTLTARRWFEFAIQPVAGFQMLTQYPLRRANRLKGRRPLANGQFIMLTRRCYDAIGGHVATRRHLLEDVQIARLVERAGLNQCLLMAGGMLRCEMYRSWPQFHRGWKRIFTELCGRSPRRLRRYALRLGLLNAALPLASILAVLAWLVAGDFRSDPLVIVTAVLGSLALLTHWLALAIGLRWSGFGPYIAPLHAPGALIVAWLMNQAASDLTAGSTISWGGKSYNLSGTTTHSGEFVSHEHARVDRPATGSDDSRP